LSADAFARAVRREATGPSWSDADAERIVSRASQYASSHYFHVPIPADTLRVEWVATHPAFRNLGLNRRLHEELFARARMIGRTTAHVGTAIGNDPAIHAYLAAGFERFAECRHADFESLYGHAGLVFLRRML
jgi:GNAT superfamily N-acetyltransferase